MNGAMAELWAKIIKKPKRTRRISIGISHHNFRAQKNCNSSEAMLKRPNTLRMYSIAAPHFIITPGSRRLLHEAMLQDQHIHARSAEGAEGFLRGVHDRLALEIERRVQDHWHPGGLAK